MRKYWFSEAITREAIEELIGKPLAMFRQGMIQVEGLRDYAIRMGYSEEEVAALPDGMFIERYGVEIEFESEPTASELHWIDNALKLHHFRQDEQAIDITALPTSQHLATIKSINISSAKPIVVTRTFAEQEFDIPCVVTEDIKEQYIAGKILVGDLVIVTYCEERIDDAIVQSKIYKSW